MIFIQVRHCLINDQQQQLVLQKSRIFINNITAARLLAFAPYKGLQGISGFRTGLFYFWLFNFSEKADKRIF